MSGSSLHSWSYAESFAHDEHVVISEYLLIFVSCLGLSLIIHYVVDDVLKWRSLAVPSTLLLGMCVGLAIRLMGGYAPTTVYDQTGTSTSSFSSSSSSSNSGDEKHSFDAKLLGFSPTIFFFGFLPPIIFNSGYHLKRKLFFSNFGAIFSLAIVGTCMSLLGFALGLYILCHKFGVLDAVKSFELIELVAFGGN
jgi:NhaP-type Na+/H+ or K+/H+ antiporter